MDAFLASRKSASAWRGELSSRSIVEARASAMAWSDTALPRSTHLLSDRIVDLHMNRVSSQDATQHPHTDTRFQKVPEVTGGRDLPHQDGEARQNRTVMMTSALQVQAAVEVTAQQVELCGLQVLRRLHRAPHPLRDLQKQLDL